MLFNYELVCFSKSNNVKFGKSAIPVAKKVLDGTSETPVYV